MTQNRVMTRHEIAAATLEASGYKRVEGAQNTIYEKEWQKGKKTLTVRVLIRFDGALVAQTTKNGKINYNLSVYEDADEAVAAIAKTAADYE